MILAIGLPARELVLFYLNADLVRGGSAAATIRVWAGAVWLTVAPTSRCGIAAVGAGAD